MTVRTQDILQVDGRWIAMGRFDSTDIPIEWLGQVIEADGKAFVITQIWPQDVHGPSFRAEETVEHAYRAGRRH